MAKSILVTGSGGLIGSEVSLLYLSKGWTVYGLENDTRADLFGKEATVKPRQDYLSKLPNFLSVTDDIRDRDSMKALMGPGFDAIVHCAAQPSHDWAAGSPFVDFEINAQGTLNLLEYTRRYCKDAPFVFMSTNKVYGDAPNTCLFEELPTRYEFLIGPRGIETNGVNESLSIDSSKHSLFGCSKLAADVYEQEYGRYFGMSTVCFRGGCLTGPAHASVQAHGFLNYLVKCNAERKPYTVFGYKGKQVRDNIHAYGVAKAIECYVDSPKTGGNVFNLGGGRANSVSILEAFDIVHSITGNKMDWYYDPKEREGDHKWYITDYSSFQSIYPKWSITRDLHSIIEEIANGKR